MGDGGLRVLGDDAYRGGDSQEQKDVQYQFTCDTRVYSPRSRQQRYSLRSDRLSEGRDRMGQRDPRVEEMGLIEL